MPTPEEEDRRHLSRERQALTNERVQHVNRIKGLLFCQGVSDYEPLRRDRLLLEQIKVIEAARDAMPAATQVVSPAPAMLLAVKGIGSEFAAVLWSEGLSRHFDNRRQVAAYAGLAPTPWQSGSVDQDRVSKSGNPRLRTTMLQIAWLWLRRQLHAALTVWFKDRVKQNGGRLKKTTIVALARKLLVALWKYVNAGVVIEGAIIKTV